jgi:hypothetical protein
MLRKVSGESVLWWLTVFLVFVSCGTSMVETGSRSTGGDNGPLGAGDQGLVMHLQSAYPLGDRSGVGSARASSGAAVGIVQKGSLPLEAALLCSGVLVSRRHVLTAASCVAASKATDLSVYFGLARNVAERVARVAALRVHPNYRPGVLTEMSGAETSHDVAVLTLVTDASADYAAALVEESEQGSPVARESEVPLFASGYGVTASRAGSPRGLLRFAPLTLWRGQGLRLGQAGSRSSTAVEPVLGCGQDIGAPIFNVLGRLRGLVPAAPRLGAQCLGTASYTDLRVHANWILGVLGVPRAKSPVGKPETPAADRAAAGAVVFETDLLSEALARGEATVPLVLRVPNAGGVASARGRDFCRLSATVLTIGSVAESRGLSEPLLGSRWESERFSLDEMQPDSKLTFLWRLPDESRELQSLALELQCSGQNVRVEPQAWTSLAGSDG